MWANWSATTRFWGLDPDEVDSSLPQLLKNLGGAYSDYAAGAFGKWHLGTSEGGSGEVPDQGGDDAPRVTGGFDYFKGFLLDQQDPEENLYFSHYDTENGVTEETPNTDYLTQEITDWAVAWINQQDEPWFAYLAHRAPHSLFHCPPAELTEDQSCSSSYTDVEKYQLMIESLDTEIARLLDEISFDPTDTLLIVAS